MSNKEVQAIIAKINKIDEYNKALESIDALKDAMPYDLFRKHIDTITVIYDDIYSEYSILRKEVEKQTLNA